MSACLRTRSYELPGRLADGKDILHASVDKSG